MLRAGSCLHQCLPTKIHAGTYLINEEHTRHDFGLALFPPLGDLAIYLFPHLCADLPCVPRKQRQEALLAGMDVSVFPWATDVTEGC